MLLLQTKYFFVISSCNSHECYLTLFNCNFLGTIRHICNYVLTLCDWFTKTDMKCFSQNVINEVFSCSDEIKMFISSNIIAMATSLNENASDIKISNIKIIIIVITT